MPRSRCVGLHHQTGRYGATPLASPRLALPLAHHFAHPDLLRPPGRRNGRNPPAARIDLREVRHRLPALCLFLVEAPNRKAADRGKGEFDQPVAGIGTDRSGKDGAPSTRPDHSCYFDVPRPGIFFRLSPTGGGGTADLSIRAAVGSGVLHGGGGLFPGHSVTRGRALSAVSDLCHRRERPGTDPRQGGDLSPRRDAGLHPQLPEVWRTSFVRRGTTRRTAITPCSAPSCARTLSLPRTIWRAIRRLMSFTPFFAAT